MTNAKLIIACNDVTLNSVELLSIVKLHSIEFAVGAFVINDFTVLCVRLKCSEFFLLALSDFDSISSLWVMEKLIQTF